MMDLLCGAEIPDHLDLGTRMLHRKNISTSAQKLVSFSYQIEYSDICSFSGNMFLFSVYVVPSLDFPGGSGSKESACNAGDLSSIPGQEDPLEKGMAIHFSILAWRIPWTEERGGL